MAIIQQIKVPLISVNDTCLLVADVSFEYGAQVKKGDIIMVFETSKTTYDVLAETDGFIEYLCERDAEYEVNELVANIYSDKDELPEKPVAKKQPKKNHSIPFTSVETAIPTWHGETLFSPAAIQLMVLKGLSHADFTGRDFVSLEDVANLAGITKNKETEAKSTSTEKQIILLPVDVEKVVVEKIASNKKREISYLSAVQSTGLTSTVHTSVNTDGIFVYLNQSLQFLKNSLLPVILYESARLLKKYRALNAYFTGDAIAYYKEVNVGFAIDINKGLKVLKVANTSVKTVLEIELEIMELSNRYIDENLNITDLTDIGFTVTDLSAEGVAFFKPLINMMNSAILGVSSIDEKLHSCMLSLTFDHRVTEGKLAAQFLGELKGRIESYQSKYYPQLNQQISCFKCFKLLQEDLSDVGFVKCITPKGAEAYICQSCLKGF